jgi:hypothetical protein
MAVKAIRGLNCSELEIKQEIEGIHYKKPLAITPENVKTSKRQNCQLSF